MSVGAAEGSGGAALGGAAEGSGGAALGGAAEGSGGAALGGAAEGSGGAALREERERDLPVMHPCPTDPQCVYCAGQPPSDAPDWSFLDAVYCISLKSRDDRMREVSTEFHRVGLCQRVVFYRPTKHPVKGIIGSWESHRAVAQNALKKGARRTLIFEDDVLFIKPVNRETIGAVAKALDELPDDWLIFHLGHWPITGYFYRRNVLKTSSACAHAYIVSPRLLDWLDRHPWGSPVKKRLSVGKALDSAYAALPGTYALFRMMVIQRVSPSDNFKRTRRIKKLRHLITRTRYREVLLSKLMRPSELVTAALSPFFWLAARLRRGS